MSEEDLSNEEIVVIKERIIYKYCAKNGWDPNNLSVSQMLEISSLL